MAEEFKVPCRVWPSRDANQNGYYDHFPVTNKNFIPEGIRLPNAKDSDLFFRATGPVPVGVNSTTPAGKLRLTYIPKAASGNMKWFADIFSVAENTTNLDPATFDHTHSGTDAVSAADVEKDYSITLNATVNLTAGRIIAGRIQRKASSDAADTLEADVGLVRVLLVVND